MQFIKTYLLPVLALAIFATSCKKDETPINTDPLSEYLLIAETQATTLDFTVKVYAEQALFVGYNTVLVQVINNATGEIMSNPHVHFEPIMDMNSGMKHACPLEQPTYNASLKAMEGTITFVMPSGMMGTWNLGLHVQNHQGDDEDLDIPIEGVEKDEARLFSFISAADSNQSVFVALVGPKMPEVGINDYEVVVYERKSMMDWPALENVQIEIDPEMPSMGHGSPNNENPTDMGNGHYMGKVNFTMTGYWKVNMKIMDAQGSIMKDDAFFDITF